MTAKRWLFTVITSLLIAWTLMYLAMYFGVPFVRDAGGLTAATLHQPLPFARLMNNLSSEQGPANHARA
jgi:hypothetical protein